MINMSELDINKIDPQRRGRWERDGDGNRVYYLPDESTGNLAGRRYRENGSSYNTFLDPGGNCFVATAVYGDGDAPEVKLLRNFKDRVLKKKRLGRSFINFYYSGAGEKTAKFIENHMSYAIPLIRRGLDKFVGSYSARKM